MSSEANSVETAMTRSVAPIVILLLSVPISAEEKTDKALKALQGKWEVVKIVMGGEQLPLEKKPKLIFTFKGTQLIPSDMPDDVATIKLDPSQMPAWFNLTDRSNEKSLGIYEISGDTLKICFADPGTERPKEFTSPKGSKTGYVELKRVRKK
jgi:uncharacterized protein (TIGR03067 family)